MRAGIELVDQQQLLTDIFRRRKLAVVSQQAEAVRADTDVVADTSASDFDTVLAVYESAGLTPVTCRPLI